MRAKELKQATEALKSVPDDEERVIIATGRYLGEGFDDARLDTLFLTMPISWRGTLAQYAGRLHRSHEAKKEVLIYDYVDDQEPVLAKMASKREAGYRAIGYEITHVDELFSRDRRAADVKRSAGYSDDGHAARWQSRPRLRRAASRSTSLDRLAPP